jgi:integrase
MAREPSPRAKSGSNRGRKFAAEPLTVDEVRRLIDAAGGNGAMAVRNRALIVLLWRSGLRISEALAVRPSDIESGKINVRRGKGSKQRIAYYDEVAVPYLQHWETVRAGLGVTGRQPLFCSVSRGETRAAGQPIDPSYVRQLLPRLARRAGINKRVHAHGLRHTHASELALSRLPLPLLAEQLGHDSTATTDGYVRKLNATELGEGMAAIGRTVT